MWQKLCRVLMCCMKQHMGSNNTATRQMWTEWLPVTPSSGSALFSFFIFCIISVANSTKVVMFWPLVVFQQDYWKVNRWAFVKYLQGLAWTLPVTCVPCIATYRFVRWAFAVAGPQLWSQLPVTTRATSASASDCFKWALKTFLLQWVDIFKQMTALLRNCSGGGYSKDYNINVKTVGGFMGVMISLTY